MFIHDQINDEVAAAHAATLRSELRRIFGESFRRKTVRDEWTDACFSFAAA